MNKQEFPRRDLTGRQFGGWFVVSFECYNASRKAVWHCRCECGTTRSVIAGDLRFGKSRSCGCKKFRKSPGENSLRAVHTTYKFAAKQRGLSWDLPEDVFRELLKQNCHYCGSPPSNKHTATRANGSIIYSGIDRIDNNSGYFPANCVACCKQCNRAKRDLTRDAFLSWVRLVYTHYWKDR